jgi:hypothetical protein
MDSRMPALTRPDASEGRAQISQQIWERASTMAAERSENERERTFRTYLYAAAFFGIIFLVVLGASLLFVMRTFAMVCSGIGHLMLRPFRAVRAP